MILCLRGNISFCQFLCICIFVIVKDVKEYEKPGVKRRFFDQAGIIYYNVYGVGGLPSTYYPKVIVGFCVDVES